MFWKKKQSRTDTLIHDTGDKESQDQRDAFRYTFTSSHTLGMRFCNKDVELIDISAGGLSFKDNGFNQGDRDRVSLLLWDGGLPFEYLLSIEILILSIDGSKICHCRFEDPEKDQTEAIHRFLLIKQKKDRQGRPDPK
ncbi:MAG: PilZ domain-containing protein [Desulfobacterium sp.]|nr:PilZ domain-containing protein [Desulfobacterium sp.]